MTRAHHPRLLATVTAVAAVVVLAGCDSGGSPSPSVSATPSTSPVTTTPASSTPPATTSAPPSPSASTSAPPTSPASTPPPSSSPTRPALAYCEQLGVAVTRVPGGAGIGYGLVSVTNRGAARCRVSSIPTLRLLAADRSALTPPATGTPAGDGIALDPGAVVSTLLADRSDTCQTNTRSVYLEVTASPLSGTVVQPLALPPCTLTVKPFTPGTDPSP